VLIYSMSVSVDGFINDRTGGLDWGVPSDERFAFHLDQVRELGACLLGRRLYETMLVWETDQSLRGTPAGDAFADVWTALPKVVFSRSLDHVEGHARLARGTLADELAATLNETDKNVEIGGAALAAGALELDLIDELRIFRNPILLGGGTPLMPPLAGQLELELLETRTFESRAIYERYRRSRRAAS
jgi:dihydrofolate reductase